MHLCLYLPIYHVTAPRVIRILTETEWNEEFFLSFFPPVGNFFAIMCCQFSTFSLCVQHLTYTSLNLG